MKTEYAGIDYSMGQSNVDKESGIHYGVISQNEVCQAWSDSSEPYYGNPTCPKCGNEARLFSEHMKECNIEDDSIFDEWEHAEHECDDCICVDCNYIFGNESAYGDEPISWYVDDAEYSAECSQDGDIFITKSPYYTICQFCSPCAPGAGYIMNECEDGIKAYCFGHNWFNDSIAPYTVYSVESNEVVKR